MYEVRKQKKVKDKDQGFENNQRRSLRSGQYKGAPQEPRVVAGPEVRGHVIWVHQPQAPVGHVILDQSTLAREKTASGCEERGYRAYNLGSPQGISLLGSCNFASLKEQSSVSDIVFDITMTLALNQNCLKWHR